LRPVLKAPGSAIVPTRALASMARHPRASTGPRSSAASWTTSISECNPCLPTAAAMPNSAMWIALEIWMRCRIRIDRVRCSTMTLCCSGDFTGSGPQHQERTLVSSPKADLVRGRRGVLPPDALFDELGKGGGSRFLQCETDRNEQSQGLDWRDEPPEQREARGLVEVGCLRRNFRSSARRLWIGQPAAARHGRLSGGGAPFRLASQEPAKARLILSLWSNSQGTPRRNRCALAELLGLASPGTQKTPHSLGLWGITGCGSRIWAIPHTAADLCGVATVTAPRIPGAITPLAYPQPTESKSCSHSPRWSIGRSARPHGRVRRRCSP
jgi:hypothetical protein